MTEARGAETGRQVGAEGDGPRGRWIDDCATAVLRAFLGKRRARPREATGPARDPMFRRSGSSFDLKSIREYRGSDDPRRIDWRLAARSGRLYVKEYYEEEREGVAILVDLSASVGVFGQDAEGNPGFADARRTAATLAWLLSALGLPLSLHAFASRPVARLERPRGGLSRKPYEAFFDALRVDEADARGTDIPGAVRAARASSRYHRLVVVSDFLDPRWKPAASPFRRNAFVRLHRPIEDLAGAAHELEVVDPESGARMRLPWDRAAAEACRERERELDAAYRAAAREGAFYRTVLPGEDRSGLYWDFLEALDA